MKPLPFREVKRKLLKAGFVEVNQIGSHVKFAKVTNGGTRTGNRSAPPVKLRAEHYGVSFAKPEFLNGNLTICKTQESYDTKNFYKRADD